jgi:hypothetical protein
VHQSQLRNLKNKRFWDCLGTLLGARVFAGVPYRMHPLFPLHPNSPFVRVACAGGRFATTNE